MEAILQQSLYSSVELIGSFLSPFLLILLTVCNRLMSVFFSRTSTGMIRQFRLLKLDKELNMASFLSLETSLVSGRRLSNGVQSRARLRGQECGYLILRSALRT